MARKQRVHYPMAIYHVIVRGNNKEKIFYDRSDKEKYLNLLERYKVKYNCEILAYVLMDNHLHMIIKVANEPLAKIMQGLQLTYTQYFNSKYRRVGHVFEQRYKALLCEKDEYLLKLIFYIHQNPVRAKVCDGINCEWSSHKFYLKGDNGLVQSSFILAMLCENKEQAISVYCDLVGISLDKKDIIIDKKEFITASKTCEIQYKVPQIPLISLEELVEKLAQENGISVDDILGKCRARNVVKIRNQFIFTSIQQGLISKCELAKRLGLDPSRITRICQEMQMLHSRNKSKKEISQT